jgi:signal transduction histidine kinase
LEAVTLHFFPFPHVFRGERRPGLLIDWPEICKRCDRQCESSPATTKGDLRLCSYGLNYLRVNDDLLIAGVAVRDFPQASHARSKRLKEVGRDAITRADLAKVIERCAIATDQQIAEMRRAMDQIVEEWRASKSYQAEVVEALRPDLQMTLAQVHDHKLFVQQIIQNMNVILENRYPGEELEKKLELASHEEAALYWAAILMDERLDAALFLDSPARIHEPRERGVFSLHGLVLKYVRIYKSRAQQNGVRVAVYGESFSKIEGNTRALGIIPQTLIDNALKYAPRGSIVDVRFKETQETVTVEVEGYGPKLKPREATRIFDLFYRAEAARVMTSEGTGFGLASAQNIARAHDTEIIVKQTNQKGRGNTYLTTFSVTFPIAR